MKILLIAVFLGFSLHVHSIEVGEQIPSCTNLLQTRHPDGHETKSCIEDFEGKDFLFVEFMSIYCGSCVRALPVVNKIGKIYSDIITTRFVTIDRSEEDLERFWNEYKTEIDHPLIFDRERVTRKPYRIKYTPTTILVDKSSTVIYKHVGEFEDGDIKVLEALLK